MRPPDGYWAGNRPELIAELRGPAATPGHPGPRRGDHGLPAQRPLSHLARPNSNSFVAYLARAVPELRLEMPAGDRQGFPGRGHLPLAMTPSGTGVQVSFAGIAGLPLALDEGLEVHLLGLVLGVDPLDLAIKLPGLGRIGLL